MNKQKGTLNKIIFSQFHGLHGDMNPTVSVGMEQNRLHRVHKCSQLSQSLIFFLFFFLPSKNFLSTSDHREHKC